MISANLAKRRLECLTRIHLDSYNFSISQGLFFLNHFLSFLIEKKKSSKKNFKIEFFGFHLSFPKFILKSKKIKKIPRHCRELKINYTGDFLAGIFVNNKNFQNKSCILRLGVIPIMIYSQKCNLGLQKKKQLIEIDEEEQEIGGYFIMNGSEKILRLIIVPKKNIPFAFSRLANINRGYECTSFSCSYRSVDRLQTSRTVHLHYLKNGSVNARIIIQKKEFFIPVIILLKALVPLSDKEIIESFDVFFQKDKILRSSILAMIKDAHEKCNLENQKKTLEFLGKIFKTITYLDTSNYELIGEEFLKNHLFINLGNEKKSKADMLIFMITKLISIQKGISLEENPDSISSQEFLLPGHLLLVFLKEKFESTLQTFFNEEIDKINQIKQKKNHETSQKYSLNDFFKKFFNFITAGFSHIIATGSYISRSNNELSQNNGLSINVERVNFNRFFSYFRSVHRGRFFLEMKNTSGRKLLSQSWGFLCPVHTPDGALCGILNHLSSSVVISLSNPLDSDFLVKYFYRYASVTEHINYGIYLPIFILDGKVLGQIKGLNFKNFMDKLRAEKVSFQGKLSMGCELIFIPRFHKKTSFPGCILLSQEARPLRPIKWEEEVTQKIKTSYKKKNYNFIDTKSKIEMIGTLEQCFLNIMSFNYQNSFLKRNFGETHSEIDASTILSLVASATPFSDLNQSPRNMYQCQMSKQSVGTPFYTFWRRDDTKSFFLLSPQVPICRSKIVQDGLSLDSFPNGFNSIVSVMTYTGFDMEDAMVINKGAIQRGFALSKHFNCFDLETKFTFLNKKKPLSRISYSEESIKVGKLLKKGSPFFPVNFGNNSKKKNQTFFCYNSCEQSIIEQLKIFSTNQKNQKLKRSLIKLRSRRRPQVGDKFASRHGQKGVFSYNFPPVDLPFSNIGMNPEIIFNPHGFPSRMTIGVILESIIGKSGALDGIFHDSSPFKFGQNRIAIYHFGEKLRKSGFQFFGNELLYSGYSGEPFSMDIFFGIVNYQRLRHMILDKYQVSNQGPKNSFTRQPIKGKKSGGSIRFGEMERDAILGQGCVFLLHDRLQASSDLHGSKINLELGNILNLKKKEKKKKEFYEKSFTNRKILLPYVIRYLTNELNSINIKTKINIS